MTYVFKLAAREGEKAIWKLKDIARIPPRSSQETFARLSWLMQRQPRYTAGQFQFPFGLLRYVDNASLQSQYWDIFLQKRYDFQPDSDTPVIIDCGGNIGLSVIRFKQQYPNSHITVFEADPVISQVLQMNLKKLDVTGVNVVKAAAWVETTELGFVADGADSGRIDACTEHKRIEAIRLADFITQPIDLLKLDIEGAEYVIIQDLYEAGKLGYIRRIICEVHGWNTERKLLGHLLDTLSEQGFSFTFGHGRCAPDLFGAAEPTSFAAAQDGKFLLMLYAWQQPAGN